MTTILCSACFYCRFGEHARESVKIRNRLYCYHPAWKNHKSKSRGGRCLAAATRPHWCPIEIIPIEDVRSVLDMKEKRHDQVV